MFSTWFATLGAALPTGMAGLRRAPVVTERRPTPATALPSVPPSDVRTGTATPQPAAPARARVVDPIDLRVVPFVPSDNGARQRRVHPRVVNPFRAFPNRGAHLYDMMNPRDPRD
ncbi:MAG: hypothetical protein EA416_17375 [Trueperaceae bacterium]|jgi:hypothetical protein|nr:MAG: hypothetical protein EA416_17375 [Trueperaceae bacterium]